MPPRAAIVTMCLDAMRTRFELVLGGADEPLLRDAGEAALREIEEAEARLSLFRADSLLSHINRAALREAVRLDADTLELLLVCQEVWELSGGGFDPTIAPRMTALGLHEGAALPDTNPGTGFAGVVLDVPTATVRFSAPRALDLGAIAKGHALDLGARVLRESGVGCALLHAGTSSALAIGAPDGAAGWSIAVRHPAGSGGHAATLMLRDNALGVSAHHGRRTMNGDRSMGHVIDPRTGEPAMERTALAAVIAPTGALADAWSTAALVLGTRPPAMPGGFRCVTV